MDDLYIRAERQRSEHERRLAKQHPVHDFSRPADRDAALQMIDDALRRPHDLFALLAGEGRDRVQRPVAPVPPPARRELDFTKPADRDAAMREVRKALRRSLPGDVFAEPLAIGRIAAEAQKVAAAQKARPAERSLEQRLATAVAQAKSFARQADALAKQVKQVRGAR